MDGSIVLAESQRKRLLEIYRRSSDPQVRLRAHIILLLADGRSWMDINIFLFCSILPVARADPKDYSGSGFDQGHIAPANDMKRSKAVMDECFLLSNICPQIGVGFDRQIWRSLEAAIHGRVEQR